MIKFDSTLTQMSLEKSAMEIKEMSRVRVESCSFSFDSDLSQLDTACVSVTVSFLKRKH